MSLQRPEIRVLISGGGTGGHIFPAVSIAQTLMSMNPRNEILFVGAAGRMEMEKVPASGFKIIGLDIAGFQRSFSFSNLLLPLKIVRSLRAAGNIIRDFRPDVAVGVGGYASGPTLFAASRMHIPCLIQEQNSFAGITNRILGSRVEKVCVAYEGMQRYFPKEKLVLTGNPVRKDLVGKRTERRAAIEHFGLDPSRPVVLVIGGSLGARTINKAIEAGLNVFREKRIQVLWQTGKTGIKSALYLVELSRHAHIKAYDFITRMDLAYAAADVVVSRAGASSVSELAVVAKPTILVPSPNVAEDHQTKNALALVSKEAAWMVSDADAAAVLLNKAIALLEDSSSRQSLSHNIAALALPHAADSIAEEIYRLANRSK